MSKDESDQNEREEMNGIGGASSRLVFAPLWVKDEPRSDGFDIEFLIAKIGFDRKPTAMFQPVDLFDIVDVVQSLGQQLSLHPMVGSELRASLGSLANDLLTLMQRHVRPAIRIRQTPSLKVVTSQH